MVILLGIIGFLGFLSTLLYGINKVVDKNKETGKKDKFEIMMIVILSFGSWLGYLFLVLGHKSKLLKDKYWGELDK